MEETTASVQSIPSQTTQTKQPNRLVRWWMRHYRQVGLASMAGSAALVCVIAVILVPIIVHHVLKDYGGCDSVTNSSTESTTVNTIPTTGSYTSSTTLQTDIVSTDPLCAANATWNRQGVTVAGSSSGVSSSSLAGLNNPIDILLGTRGDLFIADCNNYRVVYWPVNATQGISVAGTGAFSSWINSFKCSAGIVAWNNQLYVSDVGNYRILAFPLSTAAGAPDGTTILGKYGAGSTINQNKNIYYMVVDRIHQLFYLSDSGNNRILKLNLTDDTSQLMEGTGMAGSDNMSLNYPLGLTINETSGSLYVADSRNHRIQMFDFNSMEGVTVAGGNHYGQNLSQLYSPSEVAIDSHGNIYIADTGNHRIVQWLAGANEGRIIAGTSIAGANDTQLYSPVQLKFDLHYNLYVVDQMNHRIQRFDLLSNGC